MSYVFVLFWDGMPTNVDKFSGGYPYKTSIHDAKLWMNELSAREYMKMFPELVLYRWEIKLEQIDRPVK